MQKINLLLAVALLSFSPVWAATGPCVNEAGFILGGLGGKILPGMEPMCETLSLRDISGHTIAHEDYWSRNKSDIDIIAKQLAKQGYKLSSSAKDDRLRIISYTYDQGQKRIFLSYSMNYKFTTIKNSQSKTRVGNQLQIEQLDFSKH